MFTSINPATDEAGERFATLTDAELERRLAGAANAFAPWRTSSMEERVALLCAIAHRFAADKEQLAATATREMGKTLSSALAEVEKCVGGFRYYAEHGPAMLEGSSVAIPGGTATTRWLPLGPILAIMPWNFPYWQVVRFLAPAIMAGNVALLKHAPSTLGCAAAIEAAVLAAGAPEGLLQSLVIDVDRVPAIIADDRVAAVTLTGSERAGMAVAEQAGRHLKKMVLELGGSDPFIVMPSADLELAATTAVAGRTQNSGQSCICAKRIIVHAAVFDEFIERFTAGMKAVRVGDPLSADTEMGPLSSQRQREIVLGQLQAIQAAGGRLLFGGEALPGAGAFMSAGVLVDVPVDATAAREELFGPVAMVFRVENIDEAIALANDVPFGLGSSIWTSDAAERNRFERDLAAGMTAVNRLLASTPEAAFGGTKRSGYGRELGPYGMHEFMNQKTVYA